MSVVTTPSPAAHPAPAPVRASAVSPAPARDGERGAFAPLDPRTRLLAALALVVAAVAVQSIGAKALAVGVAAALIAVSGLSWGGVARRLAHVEGFMIVLLVLLPFTAPGEALLTLGPLTASDRGLLLAVSIALTVNACVLTMLALLSTAEPVRLGRALAAMGAPARLVHVFLFLLQYLALLRAELARNLEAMRARGFRPRLTRHGLRSYGNLAGMLLVRAIERAERVDEAMRCRGFTGRFPLRQAGAMAASDWRFLALAAALAAALFGLDVLL